MDILITKEEANGFLAEFADWSSLEDSVKDIHIKKASAYTQSRWSKDDVDWSDLTDEVKEAVSHYAYASSIGKLFGSVSDTITRKVKREYKKLSVMTKETEYAYGDVSTGKGGIFGYPDTLMKLSGFSEISSQGLTRT